MTDDRFLYLCNVLWPRLLRSPAWKSLEQWPRLRERLADQWKAATHYYKRSSP